MTAIDECPNRSLTIAGCTPATDHHPQQAGTLTSDASSYAHRVHTIPPRPRRFRAQHGAPSIKRSWQDPAIFEC